jgi:nicotinate-nucleotide adenylyltransferase
MRGQRRIAIYGGSFDPVHLGHLAVASETLQLFEIDRLLFLPARQAPHKLEREVTAPLHRYAMLALATQHQQQMLVSTYELALPERCYTVDTLAHFKTEMGETTEQFFIMGADSWSEITTWREWQKVLNMTNHIVVTRPGYEVKVDQVGELTSQVVDVRGWTTLQVSQALSESNSPKIYITDVAMVDVSATEIRNAARLGRDEKLATMVPQPVADYITKYELYKNSNET